MILKRNAVADLIDTIMSVSEHMTVCIFIWTFICMPLFTCVYMCLIYCVCGKVPARKRIIMCLLLSCRVVSSSLCTRFLKAQRPCNIYSISLTYTGLIKYLVPQRTNRTNFLSLPLDLVSLLISFLFLRIQ